MSPSNNMKKVERRLWTDEEVKLNELGPRRDPPRVHENADTEHAARPGPRVVWAPTAYWRRAERETYPNRLHPPPTGGRAVFLSRNDFSRWLSQSGFKLACRAAQAAVPAPSSPPLSWRYRCCSILSDRKEPSSTLYITH
ncbi:hypothetical protein EVAR_3972_1 [Eumeta japonica]|uniref:Uncharacterized protein n=1 Tax=Eumeta variegata TaxID=151549 RepID=A0A4C1SR57_EUMVA|nr:hypothetical protein EVAR_3972_1 [Eumeta japonica]